MRPACCRNAQVEGGHKSPVLWRGPGPQGPQQKALTTGLSGLGN